MVRMHRMNTSLKILLTIREYSEEVPTLLWLSQQALTLISYSKLTSANMTQNAWNNNGRKQLKSSSLVTLKRLKPHQESRTLIFRPISLSRNLLIRHRCTKLDAKLNTKFTDHQLLTRCLKFWAFQKRLLSRTTSYSCMRMKLSQFSLYFAGRLSR